MRDHRLARDAVPEVRGAADDVALDQRDLRAERRGNGRGRVPRGATTDDRKTHGHEHQATRRHPPTLANVPNPPVQELRIDELTGTYVIVAPGRATRPHVYSTTEAHPEHAGPPPDCPFCEGHEATTPPEVARIGAGEPDTPGWQVRVVPNLYPVVGQEPGIPGAHEVIVLSPGHYDQLDALPPDGGSGRTPRPARPRRAPPRRGVRAHAGAHQQRPRRRCVDRAPARAARRPRVRAAVRRRRARRVSPTRAAIS